jgi:hypothetical protein
MQPRASRIIILSLSTIGIAVVACTNSTDTTSSSSSGGSSGSTSSSSSSSGSSGGKSDGGSTSSSGGVDATKCAAETTLQKCATCCGFTDAVDEIFFKGFDTCACNGPCKTQCADTYCAATPSEPNQACGECLDADATGEQCDPAGEAECEKDAKCKAFAACDLAAKCGDKSAPDGG